MNIAGHFNLSRSTKMTVTNGFSPHVDAETRTVLDSVTVLEALASGTNDMS